jgi:hypothetical protein
MLSKFVICDVSESIKPNKDYPFVILTKLGQPVELRAFDPFVGMPPPPNSKTAAILMVSNKVDSLAKLAKQALAEALDAEGVILVNETGKVDMVLSTADVLVGLDTDLEGDISKGLLDNRGESGYQSSIGIDEPAVAVSYVYCCPRTNCSSPDWSVLRKGMEIPNCPTHNIPRELKRKSS